MVISWWFFLYNVGCALLMEWSSNFSFENHAYIYSSWHFFLASIRLLVTFYIYESYFRVQTTFRWFLGCMTFNHHHKDGFSYQPTCLVCLKAIPYLHGDIGQLIWVQILGKRHWCNPSWLAHDGSWGCSTCLWWFATLVTSVIQQLGALLVLLVKSIRQQVYCMSLGISRLK